MRTLGFLLLCLLSHQPLRADADAPLEIKAVVVAMFERGEFTGDRPGEFQHWVENYPLETELPNPHGYKPLRLNAEEGVLGVVTGIGTARAAASIMALGMDPRFDLSNAYWVVAGIAGADPNDMTLGAAAWAEWLIDGDISHSIDIREAPEDWDVGRIPLRRKQPFAQPPAEDNEGAAYRLNPGLVEWAYQLTRDVELPDNEALQTRRALYKGYPEAQKPPSVIKGDQLAAMNYWHGALLNDWANEWVQYWSQGEGEFVTSAMEDTGTLQSLTFLEGDGRVSTERVLVLRTASNFTMQWPEATALESLTGEDLGNYSAYLPALEAAYLVGSPVVREIVANWDTYKDTLPTAPE
ncbi:MAG: purine nucleoside permease [Opitutales bacterium]